MADEPGYTGQYNRAYPIGMSEIGNPSGTWPGAIFFDLQEEAKTAKTDAASMCMAGWLWEILEESDEAGEI